MNGKDCLLSCAGIVIFWGPLEERSSLRWSVRAGFGMAFLALRGFWGIWSETSEEFHHSHFVSCVLSHSVVSDSLWPHDCGPPGSSFHLIPQARILEWVAIPFSRESSWPRELLCYGQIIYHLSHLGRPYLKVTWELCRPNACVLVT